MNRNGFGLVEIVIVLAVVAILGGGFYIKNVQNQQLVIQTGLSAEQQARQEVQSINQQDDQHHSSSSTIKTYINQQYGFSINYPVDQPPPEIFMNPTSSLNYSMVGENPWWIAFYDNAALFTSMIYNSSTDGYVDIGFATVTRQWILSGSNANIKLCPSKGSNQGATYYTMSDGFHAGDDFDTYVTSKGIIAIGGGVEFVNGAFTPDHVTIDNQDPTLLVGCVVK